MRNFIWIGNVNEREIFMVAYKKVCYPMTSGCLGLMSLKNQNQATNLKLDWEMLTYKEPWTIILRAKTLRVLWYD